MSTIATVVRQAVREVPDFPKPGIMYQDTTTLFNNYKAFSTLMEHLRQRYSDQNINYIVGIDARGFIFGSALSVLLKLPFVPIRKKGKLPCPTYKAAYDLEYGSDEVELHTDAFKDVKGSRVVLIDDVLATGGTAKASLELLQQANVDCVEVCIIIYLAFLDSKKTIKPFSPVYSILDIV